MSGKPDTNLENLEKLIDRHINAMTNENVTGEYYHAMTIQLETLMKQKETLAKAKSTARFINGEQLAKLGATLGAVLMIVGHEKTSVITSKAITFVPKLF